jgi:hypothetical protein
VSMSYRLESDAATDQAAALLRLLLFWTLCLPSAAALSLDAAIDRRLVAIGRARAATSAAAAQQKRADSPAAPSPSPVPSVSAAAAAPSPSSSSGCAVPLSNNHADDRPPAPVLLSVATAGLVLQVCAPYLFGGLHAYGVADGRWTARGGLDGAAVVAELSDVATVTDWGWALRWSDAPAAMWLVRLLTIGTPAVNLLVAPLLLSPIANGTNACFVVCLPPPPCSILCSPFVLCLTFCVLFSSVCCA